MSGNIYILQHCERGCSYVATMGHSEVCCAIHELKYLSTEKLGNESGGCTLLEW